MEVLTRASQAGTVVSIVTVTTGVVDTIFTTSTTTFLTTITLETTASVTATTTLVQTSVYTPVCEPTPTFPLQIAPYANSGPYANLYLTEVLGNAATQRYGVYAQPDILLASGFYVQSGSLFSYSGRFFASQNIAEQVCSLIP